MIVGHYRKKNMKNIMAFFILPAIMVACAYAKPSTLDMSYDFKILVSTTEATALENATVIIISDRGDDKIYGKTDFMGAINIPKKKLQEARYLVICKERYFCGAIKITDELLTNYNEKFIELAPFAMR